MNYINKKIYLHNDNKKESFSRSSAVEVAIKGPLFCNISVLNRKHSALSCPRTEWINLPCNHLLSHHPQATEEGFGFGYSLLIGINAFKLLLNDATISTILLHNLYHFTPQSLRLCVAISIILFDDNWESGEIIGKDKEAKRHEWCA